MSEVHTYIETLKKIGINGIQIIQDGQEIGCFMKKEYKRQNQYSHIFSFSVHIIVRKVLPQRQLDLQLRRDFLN